MESIWLQLLDCNAGFVKHGLKPYLWVDDLLVDELVLLISLDLPGEILLALSGVSCLTLSGVS